MCPHSKLQAGTGPWVHWDQIWATGTNSWERRRRQRTTPPASSQHMAGLSMPFGDSVIVPLWRGPSISHPHLALAGHFSLGPEPEVLKVHSFFLAQGTAVVAPSPIWLAGSVVVSAMPQSAQRPFFRQPSPAAFLVASWRAPDKDTLSYNVSSKWNVVVDLDSCNFGPSQSQSVESVS